MPNREERSIVIVVVVRVVLALDELEVVLERLREPLAVDATIPGEPPPVEPALPELELPMYGLPTATLMLAGESCILLMLVSISPIHQVLIERFERLAVCRGRAGKLGES